MKRLRDGGIITESDYKGKPLEIAKKYAEDGGFEVRIVEENGVSKMLDMSVKSDRINFRVQHGFVVGAFGG
jgi:hypothetical protein